MHQRADDSLLAQHIADEVKRYEEVQRTLTDIRGLLGDVETAFIPDPVTKRPDYTGHAAAHQAWIDAQNARKEFWAKMTFELTKWGLIGFIGWLLVNVLWPALVKGHL